MSIAQVVGVLIAVRAVPSSSTPVTTPWAKEPEYFRAMEHGFRQDATHHHIHFADRGKTILFQT